MSYTKLFSRGKIGNLELKNRVVMPAMGTDFAAYTGEASDRIIRYYEERAKGGCGLIITEITRIDEETGIGMSNQLSATSAKHIPRLAKLADAVHQYDTKIFTQLHHPGRETPSRLLNGKQIVAPSAIPCGVIKEMPRALTTEECEAMTKKFVTGAVICKSAGIDGVELHGAHGYLINQFLSPYTNKRTDKYGGNFYNRMRFITEIILGIRYACGENFPVSVRISADEFVEGGLKIEDGVHIARYLESLGIHAINVSAGTYESGYSIIEPHYLPEGWKKHLAKAVKEQVKIPVIAVNDVKHPAFAEQLLEEGVSDFVGVGRGHLADPQWANKAKEGREEVLRKCIGCLYCFKIANTGKPVACTVNPCVGRETVYGDDKLVKNGDGKTVAVVGGGPAGMQAAVVLAKRGYKPVLFEKTGALGGTLNIGDKPPMKELITELVETQKAEVEQAGVEVRLNTEATIEEVKKLSPYGVVFAIGGSPIVPKIPGVDSDNVCTAEEILTKEKEVKGKKVVVIGGGVTGLETAEVLAEQKNAVTVVEMMDDVGTSLYPSVRAMLLGRLKKAGVNIVTGQCVSAIKEGEITLQSRVMATEKPYPADAVVLAVGIKADKELEQKFYDAFDKMISVGDANVPGLIPDAMKAANDKSFVF